MSKKRKAVAGLVKQIEDTLSKDASKALEDFTRVADTLGSLSVISEKEQNQMKVKPSTEFKALGRSEIVPCLCRFVNRLIALTPCPPNEQDSARNIEFNFAFLTCNLLKASPHFRDSARIPDLFRQFLAIFRRNIQQIVFALHAFPDSILQNAAGAATGVWIADLFSFVDQTWDSLLREAMPPDFGPFTLETLLDIGGRLLCIIVERGLKELPGIQMRLELFTRVVNQKMVPYLNSHAIVRPHILARLGDRVAFLHSALEELSLEKGEKAELLSRELLSRKRSSPGAANRVDFHEAIALVQRKKWKQAGSLLQTGAERLEGCARASAEALVAEGLVDNVFKILALTVSEVSDIQAARAATQREHKEAAVILGGVNLLVAVLPELDEKERSSRELFLTTGVRLLQWCEDLLSRGGSLVEEAMNHVLGLLSHMEIARRRELLERMQILYVDLAISAIKLFPFTATSSIGWVTLSNLKTFALLFGDRGPWQGAAERTDVDAEEYLWRPSSEGDPPDAGGYDSRAIFFGVTSAILSVLHACCRNRVVVQCAVLPQIEVVVHSLRLVPGSLTAVFGPRRVDDSDPPRSRASDAAASLDMICELKVAHNNLMELLATVLDALDSLPETSAALRKDTLLEAARAGAAAACADVLRVLRALRRVAPSEAARDTWVQLEAAVGRLWKELARGFRLKACSNPGCEGKVVEESKNTFHKCGRCGSARYCSKKCQVKDWASGHRRQCSYSGN
ncbi:hypothetical protein KFL_001390280 [Klebsormidium nitens]|uniref:MYND-type domain-containing protein n=1 Tax=Klebsormidium nitens TaxID=105231 RepID=A0A1Y1HX21_KLENI|nr:hypothetical protein KFL_001390280 [Klebsormidium nitens]|eukprot:GAQ83210.1 hypothetical protein KFL_001390280 [Klebsormidium nitens]